MFAASRIWRARLAVVLALLVLASACSSGQTRLSRAIDNLDLPGNLVEVGEAKGGPDIPFAGDYPRVSKYYVSQQDPFQTCKAMRGWALEEGLSEDTVPEGLTCSFRGVVDSNFISILVTGARDEIGPRYGLTPISVEVEHEAVVEVHMSRN